MSNNSDRRRVEKVLFASSATESQTLHVCKILWSFTHFSGNEALREESFSWLSMVSQAMRRHVVG